MKVIQELAFSKKTIDSCSKLRGDKKLVETLASSREALNMVIWNGQILLNHVKNKANICYLNTDHKLLKDCQRLAFIGLTPFQIPIFLYELKAWGKKKPTKIKEVSKFFDPFETTHPLLPEQNRFTDLKKVLIMLKNQDLSICGIAKGLYEWHQSNKFCSRCGHTNFIKQSGWELSCSTCSTKCFPRTDPVVIMLIENGNSLLLGRSPMWPKGMYSCLAGFLEPGETIEDAVKRETFEEVGVNVSEVRYISNQPWPFPHSLMIGCRAKALSKILTIDHSELECARWFDKDEVDFITKNTSSEVKLAREGTIANFLIKNWLNANN